MPRSGDRGTVEVILEYCFSREEIRMDWLVKRLLQYWGGLVMAWTWRLALHLICLCPRHLSLADTDLPWLSWHPSQATFPSMSYGKGRVRKHVLCPLEPLSRIPFLIGSGDTFRVLGFFFPFLAPEYFLGDIIFLRLLPWRTPNFTSGIIDSRSLYVIYEVSRLRLQIYLIVLVFFLSSLESLLFNHKMRQILRDTQQKPVLLLYVCTTYVYFDVISIHISPLYMQ